MVELDIVVRGNNMIIPIEVKKKRGNAKSLRAVINDKENPIRIGIKLSLNNIGFDGDILLCLIIYRFC